MSFNAHFVAEIMSLALDIARIQRNEDHLQPPIVLHEKFVKEQVELAEAKEPWDELPDVVYYATCLAAQGENDALVLVMHEILPRYGVSVAQAKAATLAKYRLRAAGNKKDIESERAAILEAVRKV